MDWTACVRVEDVRMWRWEDVEMGGCELEGKRCAVIVRCEG